MSTDRANFDTRRDKIVKENTGADIALHGVIHENASQEDASMSEAAPLIKSLTQTISKEMEVEPPPVEGAACQEIIEEMKEKENAANKAKVMTKVKRTQSSLANKVLEGINEIPSQENLANNVDKENKTQEAPTEDETNKKTDDKQAAKKKIVKKKVLTDKNENECQGKVAEDVKEEKKTAESTEKEKPEVITLTSSAFPYLNFVFFECRSKRMETQHPKRKNHQ